MTLLVALAGKDGIVAAADSRGTFGDPRSITAQNDSQQKITLVSNHAVVLIAGSGEMGVQIVEEVTNRAKKERKDGATAVAQMIRETAKKRYAEWFPHLKPAIPPGTNEIARPDLVFLVAGYDADSGNYTVPRLYQVVSAYDFPPSLHNYGFVVCGVVQYALYLLNRLYEPDRSLKDLTALGVYVITETASQDGKVGGPTRVATITPDQGAKVLSDAEITAVHASNNTRAALLRQSFYTSTSSGTQP